MDADERRYRTKTKKYLPLSAFTYAHRQLTFFVIDFSGKYNDLSDEKYLSIR